MMGLFLYSGLLGSHIQSPEDLLNLVLQGHSSPYLVNGKEPKLHSNTLCTCLFGRANDFGTVQETCNSNMLSGGMK